jgi:murein DD-endopeptidase / murein LD-carboxypeptidase
MLEIPELFWTVEYDGENLPRESGGYQLTGGANCQVFAYAILQHFGIAIPPLRSSDLWSDTRFTRRVSGYRPLDLLLFNRTEAAWGAHVALFVGENKAIHLSASEGRPVIWRLEDFAIREQYAVLLGGKRVLASESTTASTTGV